MSVNKRHWTDIHNIISLYDLILLHATDYCVFLITFNHYYEKQALKDYCLKSKQFVLCN